MYKVDKLVCTGTYTYPCLHVKYICFSEICAPSKSSKHHCSVVVNLGEGVSRQWRWLLSSCGLDSPHFCRNSGTTATMTFLLRQRPLLLYMSQGHVRCTPIYYNIVITAVLSCAIGHMTRICCECVVHGSEV